MSKKIKILLEDDNEIKGNGLGHPLRMQYLPTKRYLEILKKHDIRGTFYIDMAHYLFLKDNESFDDFKFQAKTIEETIKMLTVNGMDVQLHLHSQWVGAEIKRNKIYVTKKWNIGQLNPEQQKLLFKKSYDALFKIISNYIKKPSLNSFKAGSWGLQPFCNMYDIFRNFGIKLVMGPIDGLKINDLCVNYNGLHSNYFPYYASKNDIRRVDNKKNVVVLPMTPTHLNWPDFLRYIFEIKFLNKINKINNHDIYDLPKKIKKLNPIKGKDKLNIGFKPFKTHLKINAQSFWYLKKTFKRSYEFISKSKSDYKLIVIETHTKDFSNNINDIDKFFKYLRDEYKNIEFVTSSDLVNDINEKILNPLDE